MEQPVRVLTLGDGDFSFSLALSKLYPHWKITATAFDDLKEVHRKYSNAVGVLDRLKLNGVTVVCNVNATNISAHSTLGLFDFIIFNHPHVGVEDFMRHRALLGHFFHSAKQHIVPGGLIRVALTAGQPELWQVEGMAVRNGLCLVHTEVFDDERYPGYQRRRHQSGRSFLCVDVGGVRAEQRSMSFDFAEADASVASTQEGGGGG